MFDDYTIAAASVPHDQYETDFMDENISPTSSRSTTPAPEDMSVYHSPPHLDMVTELSHRFKQQSLGSRRQRFPPMHPAALLPPTLDIEPPSLPLRSSRRRSSSALLVWQQRQTMTRQQCTPAHLLQISKLVEELSQDINPSCNATHPSSSSGYRAPLSPTSNPSSCSSFESTPTSSGSEDSGFHGVRTSSRRLANRVNKEARRRERIEGLERKQKLVLKKIRLRKSLVSVGEIA
ncbi:MAG: hypothetical protein Q9207_003046 [Kuettlingeria erythrocarpa]